MEALTIAGIVTLGMKFLDFVKFLRAANWNAVITQAASWLIGIALVFLVSAANIAEGLDLGFGMTLQDMDAASKVIAGLGLLSVGSVVVDFRKATDKTDSAVTPSLLPGPDGFK